MIHAYDKIYLEKASKNVANMIDLAVNYYNFDVEKFFNKFINSNIDKKIESGDTKTIAGSSSYELLLYIYNDDSILKNRPTYRNIKKSKEYWLGKSLCFYQWYKNVSFKYILENINIKKLLSMYSKYHTIDIMQFVDKLDEILYKNKTSKLKQKRESLNISQKELSNFSNVPYRTIQQYEQKQKNINNAKVSHILSIAKALKCNIEDILE